MKVVIPVGENSVTIGNLTVGETYTVNEDTNWAWRFTASGGGNITLNPSGNEMNFTNTFDENGNKWLDANYSVTNTFTLVNNTVVVRKKED